MADFSGSSSDMRLSHGWRAFAREVSQKGRCTLGFREIGLQVLSRCGGPIHLLMTSIRKRKKNLRMLMNLLFFTTQQNCIQLCSPLPEVLCFDIRETQTQSFFLILCFTSRNLVGIGVDILLLIVGLRSRRKDLSRVRRLPKVSFSVFSSIPQASSFTRSGGTAVDVYPAIPLARKIDVSSYSILIIAIIYYLL